MPILILDGKSNAIISVTVYAKSLKLAIVRFPLNFKSNFSWAS